MIIVSLATYPARIQKLHTVIPYILKQTLKFDKVFINIPNNLTIEDYDNYEKFKDYDNRIEIYRRDYRWRSANKYIWTYKEHPNDVIITCDDDLLYNKNYFNDLYIEFLKNQNCIICHEINPIVIFNEKIHYINGVDLKLKQKEFGKYLTGCCLFPPLCMEGTDLYNYEQFFKITQGCHDELWFWIQSTLKGIQCIGLNKTWSFEMDDCALQSEDTALSNINGKKENIAKYESIINTEYGKQLLNIMQRIPTEFDVTADTLLAYIGNMSWLNRLYTETPLLFRLINMSKSTQTYFLSFLRRYKWKKVDVKII